MAMTPEEQEIFNALKAENAQLKQNQTQQNSYITKLEQKANGTVPVAAPQQVAGGAMPQHTMGGSNPAIQQFVEEQMKEKTLSKAVDDILTRVSKEEYAAVEPDFLKFLQENMSIKQCTVNFIVDAFGLILGRARMRADHPINQIGKGGTPAATPITNGSSIEAIQATLRNQPPVMSGKDSNAAHGAPQPGVDTTPKSTREAFKNFGDKLRSGNPFNN